MARAIHTVDDWTDDDVASTLARAGELADGAPPKAIPGLLLGVCMVQTSLRTRVGFESAARRLGIDFVETVERRASAESMPERIEDTVRVMSGYCDALVVRAPRASSALHRSALPDTIWLNAGDTREHPTQAMIDLFAIERLLGPITKQRVAIVGDLRMRAARSLLGLLRRKPGSALLAVSAPELADDLTAVGVPVVPDLDGLVEFAPDVVYLAGIPHQAASEEVRTRLRLDRRTLDRLPGTSVVLSPLPLIDEVASNAREDHRARWFEQSDLGLWMRMAILEHLLG